MDRILCKTTHKPRLNRAGHTLLEVLIALALFGLVSMGIWVLWSSSRRGEEQLSKSFSAQQDLVLTLQRIAFELQEGRAINFPPANGDVKSGLSFVDANGRPIAYFLEPSDEEEGDSKLFRVDLTTMKKKLIADRVNYFKVAVEPSSPGKKPCLASLNLSIFRKTKDIKGEADSLNLLRKVFLRNLKQDSP